MERGRGREVNRGGRLEEMVPIREKEQIERK